MRATIKLKLAVNFTILTLLAMGVAWLGIGSLSSLNSEIASLVNGPVVRMQRAEDLKSAVLDIVPEEKNMILATSPQEIEQHGAELMKGRTTFLKKFENMQNIATEEVRQKLVALTPTWVRWTTLLDQERELMERNAQAEAKALSLHDSRAIRLEITKQLEEVDSLEGQLMKKSEANAASLYNNAWLLLMGAAGAALLISVTSAVLLSLSIGRGLRRAVSLADAVSLGDLHNDVKASSNDEIKDLINSLNRMTANLRLTAEVADAIANGDLSKEAKPLSEKRHARPRAKTHDRETENCRLRFAYRRWQCLLG